MKRLLFVSLMALAACSQEPVVEEAPVDTATESATPQEADDLAVNLDATGLSLPGTGGEAGMIVPFGSNRAAAEHTLGAVLGEVRDRGGSEECGAGPMQFTHYDGVTLNFQEDRLVGWISDGERYLPDATRGAMGAGGGLTKANGTTLGEEYYIGPKEGPMITMIFDGPNEDATVERMWAGTNCIFR